MRDKGAKRIGSRLRSGVKADRRERVKARMGLVSLGANGKREIERERRWEVDVS